MASFAIALQALKVFFSCCFCGIKSKACLVKVFPVRFGIVDVYGAMSSKNFFEGWKGYVRLVNPF